METDNPENRSTARLKHQSPVVLESCEVGELNDARMFNFSRFGIYFESDFYLAPGTELFIGLKSSPFSAEPGVFECYRSVIKWRKYLEDAAFDYGYGVELKQRVERPNEAGAGEPLRRHPRRSCSIPALVDDGEFRRRVLIENASQGGVFIKCDENLQAGKKVFLTIPLKQKQKLVTRTGKIAWTSEQGVGIKFEPSEPTE
jgi:hypothetical protein